MGRRELRVVRRRRFGTRLRWWIAAAAVTFPAAAVAVESRAEQTTVVAFTTAPGKWTTVIAPRYPAGAHDKFGVVSLRHTWPEYSENIGGFSDCRYRTVETDRNHIFITEIRVCGRTPTARVWSNTAQSLLLEVYWWPAGVDPPSLDVEIPDLCAPEAASLTWRRR